mmetsp:Transcript_32723/g.49318  ORF Transcript_32723/g.49318 Transcript_32723/m.49318 type:complete len:98 (-) Transcript_32723:796-1089(-)
MYNHGGLGYCEDNNNTPARQKTHAQRPWPVSFIGIGFDTRLFLLLEETEGAFALLTLIPVAVSVLVIIPARPLLGIEGMVLGSIIFLFVFFGVDGSS